MIYFYLFVIHSRSFSERGWNTASTTARCFYNEYNEMKSPLLHTKKAAAGEWCKHASEHAAKHGGNEWKYTLIPHDAVKENMTVEGFVRGRGR